MIFTGHISIISLIHKITDSVLYFITLLLIAVHHKQNEFTLVSQTGTEHLQILVK